MNNFYTHVAQWGDNLLVRAIVDGQRRNFKVPYKPTLFVPSPKESKYKTLAGKSASPIRFDTISKAKDFVKLYRNNHDKIFGLTQYPYTYIADQYPEDIKYDPKYLKIITIDIEVKCENGFPDPEKAEEEMLSITVKDHRTGRFTVWGINPYINNREDVTYILCDSELKLLHSFISWWSDDYPDMITGWNSEMFDIPYICNRVAKVINKRAVKLLSPWGIVREKTVRGQYRDMKKFEILGVSDIDYLQLYKKFTYVNRESYRLDYIAEVELGDHKDGNPFDTFKEWYTKDYQSFIDYNIQDVEIVDNLEKKMRLIELLLTMTYDAKVNMQDTFTTVKYWEVLIYNYLLKRSIVIPQKDIDASKDAQYPGGFVKEPKTGESDWVVSFDLNSLYPHLIMQYNISPETMIDQKLNVNVDGILNKEYDTSNLKYAMAASGQLYDKSKRGFLPELMDTIYNERVVYKKKMLQLKQELVDDPSREEELSGEIAKYNNFQMAKKIQMNSCYGAVGNAYFRFFQLRNAEAITLSGQMAIKWISKKLNEYINNILKTDEDYVIAVDTDSCYLRMDGLVNKVFDKDTPKEKIVDFLDTIAKDKLEPFISECYQDLANYTNAYEQKMIMSREAIADRGIWTAKKRYVLNVWDNEGVRYKTPQLKIMGIEAIRSSTPTICRPALKKALSIIMNGTEQDINEFIQEFRTKFVNALPSDISFPRSVNGLAKWTGANSIVAKGTPVHVRGALLYNHMIKEKKLINKFPLIGEGEKVKFIYLKTPNIIQSHVVSFITLFPDELGLHKSIDFDLQFEKAFMSPLMAILKHLEWNIDLSFGTQATLEDFF